MKHLYITTLLIAFLAACTSMPVGNANVPEPAKPVELSKYTGLWYEMARYENRFEKDCEGVTAQYTALEDGRIAIVNTCHKGSAAGEKSSADGKAKIVEGSNNTKLKVSFFGPFYLGNYWVLDRAEDYSWSIVGEPSGRYLWILTRAAAPSAQQKAVLYKKVAKLGYDTKLLRETKHNP